MKSKKETNKPITHQDFQEYIKIASEVFTTKAELVEIKQEIKDDIVEMKNEILNSNDKIAQKLDKHLTDWKTYWLKAGGSIVSR